MARFLHDWRHFGVLATVLLAAEAAISVAIIVRVPYTEIDWIAYMQEVEGWVVSGETNYLNLRGDTGPLVYPAGFLYVFGALRWLTGGGRGAQAIRAAQWIFCGVYLLTQAVVLRVYARARVGPPWAVLLLALSKRLHSLYSLRLFNDCVCMLIAYIAVWACTHRKWLLGVLLFSSAVSVKMNALLFVPGLLFLLVRNVGLLRTFAYLLAGCTLQAALGAPFLATHPREYLTKAFELSRVFFYTWTVNWKFLPEDVFVSAGLASALLAAHLLALVVFGAYRWCEHDGGVVRVLARVLSLPPAAVEGPLRVVEAWCGVSYGCVDDEIAVDVPNADTVAAAAASVAASVSDDSRDASGPKHALRRRHGPAAGQGKAVPTTSSDGAEALKAVGPNADRGGAFRDNAAFVVYVLFVSNFVGIVFARTVHYQFYSWYFHTLPFLCSAAGMPLPAAVALAAGAEYAFNVGDAAGAGSPLSSFVLQAAHFLLLGALLVHTAPSPRVPKKSPPELA